MRLSRLLPLASLTFPALLGGYLFVVGCGDDLGPAGSPVAGAADMHCVDPSGAPIKQPIDLTRCMFTPDAGVPPVIDAAPVEEYGATLFNQVGNDDDCKYHYEWSAPGGIYQNSDVAFQLKLTSLVDGTPVTGAEPRVENYLDETHAGPTTNQVATEQPGGVYDISPVRFDKPGRWTVRFHVYEKCFDLIEESPHGHAAFFVDVK